MKSPSENHDVWVGFYSVLYRVRFGFLHIFYFRVRFLFGSWQNLGSGSVRAVIKRRWYLVAFSAVSDRVGNYMIKTFGHSRSKTGFSAAVLQRDTSTDWMKFGTEYTCGLSFNRSVNWRLQAKIGRLQFC